MTSLRGLTTISFYLLPVLSAPIETKNDTKIDVNDFIGKIMASKNFAILINRIAEKAAEKIQKRHIEDNENKDNSSEIVMRHNIDDIEESTTTNVPKLTVQEGKSSNIDMTAVLEKFAKFPLKDVSLNYKNFVNAESKVKKTNKEDNLYGEKGNKVINNFDSRQSDEVSAEISSHIIDENMKTKMMNETYLLHLQKSKGANKGAKHSRSSKEFVTNVNIETMNSASNDNPDSKSDDLYKVTQDTTSVNVEEKYNEKHLKESSSNVAASHNNFRANNKIKKPSKEVSNSVIIKNNESDTKESNENKVEKENETDDVIIVEKIEYKALSDPLNESSTQNVFVRKEGKKLYTYEKSPDYEEYHEKLQKVIEKTKSVIPGINERSN